MLIYRGRRVGGKLRLWINLSKSSIHPLHHVAERLLKQSRNTHTTHIHYSPCSSSFLVHHHPKHLGLNLIHHSMLHLAWMLEEHRVLPPNRFLGIEEILMRDDGRIRD